MKKLKDLTPADLMDEGRRWVIAPVEFMGEREIPNRGDLQESSIQSVRVDLPRIDRRGPGAEMVAVEPFDSGEKSPKSLLWESVMENSIRACAYIQVAARKQAGDALAAFDDDDIGIQTQRERLLSVAEREGCESSRPFSDDEEFMETGAAASGRHG